MKQGSLPGALLTWLIVDLSYKSVKTYAKHLGILKRVEQLYHLEMLVFANNV